MTTSAVADVLATELSKVSDQLVTICIVLAIVFVILGLGIGAIKNFLRNIRNMFK